MIFVDKLDRLPIAIGIARRSRAIALQSVYVGMGLSILGMIAAALGYLTPLQGALMQEAIDVAVVLNALRALTSGRHEHAPFPLLSSRCRTPARKCMTACLTGQGASRNSPRYRCGPLVRIRGSSSVG